MYVCALSYHITEDENVLHHTYIHMYIYTKYILYGVLPHIGCENKLF